MLRGIHVGLLVLLLVGCEGTIGGAARGPRLGDEGPSTSPDGSFGIASQASLLRLTKQQHQRTMEDLLGHFLGVGVEPVLAQIEPAYGILPDDTADVEIGGLTGSSFRRMSQNVGELHIRGYLDIAQTASNAIVGDDVRRSLIFGDCVNDATDDHAYCIAPFIDSFGLRVLRRPLTDEEHDFFLNVVFANDGTSYEATPQALSDLLVAFMIYTSVMHTHWRPGSRITSGARCPTMSCLLPPQMEP